MKCDICNERDADIEILLDDGVKAQRLKLCYQCLKNQIFAGVNVNGIMEEILNNRDLFTNGNFPENGENPSNIAFGFMPEITKSVMDRINSKETQCPQCGTSYKKVLTSNKVGCPKCYEVFGDLIDKKLFSINKVSRYKGRLPKNMNGDLEKKIKIRRLKTRLNVELNLENFEEASKINEEINSLEEV